MWTTSIAELNGKVYITVGSDGGGWPCPLMFDFNTNYWIILPELPTGGSHFSLVAVPSRKQLLAIGGINYDNDAVDREVTSKVFVWDEKYEKWLSPYPNMPTARHSASCTSHGLSVIVAGGITLCNPLTTVRTIEVLHIADTHVADSYWCKVESLPHASCDAVPLIFNDNLYIAGGYDETNHSTCNIVSASLLKLLQSGNNNSSGEVWKKLPDMPYCSFAINHYKGHLIAFTGDYLVELPDKDKPVLQVSSSIHIYNPNTRTWDCVGDTPHGYYLGKSVHINDDKIIFVGDLTGSLETLDEEMMTTCTLLTFASK